MYGNEPARWSDDAARRRPLALRHQRAHAHPLLHADGTLDFKTKEGAGAAPPGCHALVRRARPAHRAACRWPSATGRTLGLIDRPDLLALDTGCVWGGALTAVRVDGGRREVVQVACEQAQRPG